MSDSSVRALPRRFLSAELARVVALVNTFGPPAELDRRRVGAVDPRAALAELVRERGITALDVDDDDVTAVTAVAGRLHRVFGETDLDEAAAMLNELLADVAARPRLVRYEGLSWQVFVDQGEDAPLHERLGASGAHALALLMSDRTGRAWGTCSAPGCRRVYIDDGRGTPRQYCSRACATRVRVAAYRARARQAASSGHSRSG